MGYQPTYPNPYMESIDVDKSDGNIFKCLINPKDIVKSATIRIYSNADNSLKKTVTSFKSSFPFKGGLSDNSWLESVVDGASLSNGTDYKWTITLVYSDDSSLTSPEYYFKARTTPVVTFNVSEKIESSTHTFTATYEQAENVGVAYFQYDLYDGSKLVSSSGKVFTQNISHTFESLVNGTQYVVALTIVNNDGIEIYEECSFNVEYRLATTTIAPVLSVDTDKTCISVDFSNNASIPATLVGTTSVDYKIFKESEYSVVASGNIVAYSSPSITIEPYDNLMANMYVKVGDEIIKISKYTRNTDGTIVATLESGFGASPVVGSSYEICSYYNGIHLDKKESILWDTVSDNPLSIPDKSTQIVHWHGAHGFTGTILEKINSEFPLGSTIVSYDGENFIYKIGTKDAESYSPYIGRATAIAGGDEHSKVGEDSNVTYDDNYLYVLSDDDELQDTDIIIDNDLSYKYWWLIALLPDTVRFKKTVSFIESEV